MHNRANANERGQMQPPGAHAEPNGTSRSPYQAEMGVTKLQSRPSIAARIRKERGGTPKTDQFPELRESRTRPANNLLAPEQDKFFQPWKLFYNAITCCIPSFVMDKCCGMHNEQVRRAWREKVGLCTIAFILCTALAYLTFAFQNTTCVADKVHFMYKTVLKHPDAHQVIIHGGLYNSTSSLATHQSLPYFQSHLEYYDYIDRAAGLDISAFFPVDIGDTCASLLTSQYSVQCSDSANFPGIVGCHSPASTLKVLKDNFLGVLYYDFDDVNENHVIFNNKVLDVKSYLKSNTAIFGTQVDPILSLHLGKDVTKALIAIANGQQIGMCLTSMFMVGAVESKSIGCFMADVILYVSLIIICSLIIIKFTLAVYFRWAISNQLGALEKNRAITQATRRQEITKGHFAFSMADAEGSLHATYLAPKDGGMKTNPIAAPPAHNNKSKKSNSKYSPEIYTIMLVTCYSENEEEIRNTFDSLAETDYSEDYKVLFVVADGLVKGQGNSVTTPDIVLSLLELDSNWPEPTAFAYMAVANGAKQINYAKVYVAWYNHKERSVPTIVVVKTGNASEQNAAKPGNRGKRDSQIMLMKFLEHITFNERLCPFEYDLFQKMHFLMGVTPDHFEIVLMVDADTKVAPDSVARMVACMGRDPLIMGLCGETRIGNKSQTYVN
jgi:chitin synthase